MPQVEFDPGRTSFNFSAAIVNIANWFASGQLGFLIVLVVVVLSFGSVSLALKSRDGSLVSHQCGPGSISRSGVISG